MFGVGELLKIPKSLSSAKPAQATVRINGTAGTSVSLGVCTAVTGDVCQNNIPGHLLLCMSIYAPLGYVGVCPTAP